MPVIPWSPWQSHLLPELLAPAFLCFVLNLTLVCSYCLTSMLADKLNMSPEEAERWIVNLIRNARLDAKIDSKLVRPFDATIFYNPGLVSHLRTHAE